MTLATTKMTSKGQIVIPEQIREQLGLKEGIQFVVIAHGDTVILKSISAPTLGEFKEVVEKVRNQAQRAGVKKSDLTEAIKQVRRRK
ncbi:MAG: AbrB/MazE/SpoVT family DNA-binding domain-containing protein [Pseudomonadota bacterium]|nr:AbrB/MazE/SpoVT family DNA-binding domain-containing protein [Pseudomonadota bacterium]